MDAPKEKDKPRYWREVIDKETGVRRVTVAVEVTFALDGTLGMLVEQPRLVIAGGSVATSDLVTVDEVLTMVTETHELLSEDDVDVIIQNTSDADSQPEAPPLLLVTSEEAPHQRSRQEEIAAHHPTRFT